MQLIEFDAVTDLKRKEEATASVRKKTQNKHVISEIAHEFWLPIDNFFLIKNIKTISTFSHIYSRGRDKIQTCKTVPVHKFVTLLNLVKDSPYNQDMPVFCVYKT